MEIKPLDWDTSFFGFRVGFFDYDNSSNINFTEVFLTARAQGYKLVYSFGNESLGNQVSQFDSWEIVDVGSKVTFTKRIKVENRAYDTVVIYCQNYPPEQFVELSIQAGIYSRFKTDSNFEPGKFQELYEIWLLKSLTNEIADKTFLSVLNGKVAGFLTTTLKDNRAELSLMAVDSNFRRMGVASSLINTAEEYYAKQGFEEMNVVTQGSNMEAISLYKAFGYSLSNEIFVSHFWNQYSKP